MIHTSRPDGYLDFFNQKWLTYLGRPFEDLQGWKWTAFIHPHDVEGPQRISISLLLSITCERQEFCVLV